MESSKEQDVLEAAAALHLILLSNSLKRSYNEDDSHDHGGNPRGSGGGGDGGFGLMKKKKQDYGVKSTLKHKNDHSANSITCSSSESIKSGISMEEVQEKDHELTGRRKNRRRWRSIVDIYRVTRPL